MKYLLVIFLAAPALSFSQTDYACVSDCTNNGYQYGLCTDRCTTNDNNGLYAPQQPKQTDYQCVTDCTNKGYQYNLCTEKCSF